MVTLPSVGGLARQYLASFSGDDFTPKTLEQAGILSDAGKTLMASIPAANLAVQSAAMKQEYGLEKQDMVNEALLTIEEMKNERARKESILNQLGSSSFAGKALEGFFSGSGADDYSKIAQQAAVNIAYEEPPSLVQAGMGGVKVDVEDLIQGLASDPKTLLELQKLSQTGV